MIVYKQVYKEKFKYSPTKDKIIAIRDLADNRLSPHTRILYMPADMNIPPPAYEQATAPEPDESRSMQPE